MLRRGLTGRQAAEVTSTLRALRVGGGDAAAGTRMPPAVTGDREPADQAGDGTGIGLSWPVPPSSGKSRWAQPGALGVSVAGYFAAKAAIESCLIAAQS
jgi:hypothetical protein